MRLRGLFVALLPLFFAACLDTPTLPAEARIEETTFATSLGVDLAASTKVADALYYRDVTVGTGATLAAGDSARVYFDAYLANGTRFDGLAAPNNPLAFRIGAGVLIPGFEAGVVGMRVGGTRQLIIGPSLGFGQNDIRDTAGNLIIPRNSVLVFTVQAVSAP